MTIGFTGTQLGMTRDQHHALQTLLQTYAKLPDPEFHHGDCVGSDSLAASTARDAGFRVIGHPPLVPCKRTFFDSDETPGAKAMPGQKPRHRRRGRDPDCNAENDEAAGAVGDLGDYSLCPR